MPSSTRFPTCFASCSIGMNSNHSLRKKLKAISSAGFDAIELSMPDLISFASEQLDTKVSETDYDALCSVGGEVQKLCHENKVSILMLQPFANFEGWPANSPERANAFKRARGWIRVMEAVGTDMLQVGSTDSEGISASVDELASDLRELADMLAAKGFRMACENWCWATRAPGWRDVWEIVERVNRSNVGLCLDTFQSAGGEWADPTTESGLLEGAGMERIWKESLEELAKIVPPEKIFLLQISDAYKMDPPLDDGTDEAGLRSRGRWSHDYRPLPYDGGYLPVMDFTRAVLGTGFKGWMSIEVFDGKEKEKYRDMSGFAQKAMGILERLLKESDGEKQP